MVQRMMLGKELPLTDAAKKGNQSKSISYTLHYKSNHITIYAYLHQAILEFQKNLFTQILSLVLYILIH